MKHTITIDSGMSKMKVINPSLNVIDICGMTTNIPVPEHYFDQRPTHRTLTDNEVNIGILVKDLWRDHDEAIEDRMRGQQTQLIVELIGDLATEVELIVNWQEYINECEQEALYIHYHMECYCFLPEMICEYCS